MMMGPPNDVLSIRSIKTSPEKVDHVTFHPVQPWVAFADRSSGVTVWNYESNEVVYANQLGGADDGALQESTLRQRADANAVSLGGTPAPALTPSQEASLAAKSTASGGVLDLCFFDLDTCFWQLAAQNSQQHGAYDASAIPSMSGLRGVEGRRWIVAACDNKVTLHDLCSSSSLDISRSAAFESKAPTRIAFLLLNAPSLTGAVPSSGAASAATPTLTPILAVGVSSGAIYLVSPISGSVYGKLSGAHRGAVTSLIALGANVPGGPDRLVSTSADGSVAVWDPSRTPRRGAEREMAAIKSFKAHDNAVVSASLFVAYSGETPEALPLRLATVGEDKKVALWDVSTWNAINRIQPLPKQSCSSVAFAPWGSAGLGVRPSLVLASGESTSLLGLNPASGEIVPLINLMGMVDPGQKKAPKIYEIAVHPTRPHLLAAATNTGVVLLTADPSERPAMVALPAQVLTLEALMHAAGGKEGEGEEGNQDGGAGAAGAPPPPPAAPGSKGAQGLTYVMASGGKLWSTAYRMESKLKQGASERVVSLEAGPREAIADLDHPGRPILSCSATGRSISLVWPETRAYSILSLAPTGTWETIDRGSGNCIAWATTAPMYALVSVPNIPVAEVKAKKGFFGLLGGGKKERKEGEGENLEAEAAVAAARAAAASTTIQIHGVDETSGRQFVAAHDVNLGGAQPVLLHGGALLGIVAIDPVTLQRSLRFFSWRDFAPVGPSLPEPLWVAWEPDCTLCALAYEHTIELCRTHPTFQRFASLSIPHSQAGIWQSRQLFVSAPSSLHLVFADPAQEFVQEVALASFQGGVASKVAPPADATPLPPEQMRPAGPVMLAGVRHSYLWLADGFGRPFLVSLRHPGLRLRCLAARGELTTARTIAGRGLSPSFHDDVARFLAAMSPGDGVKEALLLPGLTPETEMALAIRDGAWDRAARCFQALALGVSDKELLALTGAVTRVAEGDVAERLAGFALGSTPIGADHSAAVAEILNQHAAAEAAANAPKPSPPNAAAGDAPVAANRAAAGKKPAGSDASSDDGHEEGEPAPFVDPVDWDAPLKSRWAKKGDQEGEEQDNTADDNDAAGVQASAAAAAMKVVDPGELRRVHTAAELGLRFANAAAEAGYDDAARTALGVLVRFAPVLPPVLLEELVASMGRCRMTESTRNLASAAAVARPGSALQDPGVGALLAALAGGAQGDAVQTTLHASGLEPLSAVFAAVWGQGSCDVAIDRWKSQLAGQGRDVRGVAIAPPSG